MIAAPATPRTALFANEPARAGSARAAGLLGLVKPKQTILLLLTGLAGFASARCPIGAWSTTLQLLGSLGLAVAGSTVLNMAWDRDLDARMQRTAGRALASGALGVTDAVLLGTTLSFAGVAWAIALSQLYGILVLLGLFLDAVVYTVWLKRRTPWSIIWGGLSGAMPIIAGRALAAGAVDGVVLLLGLAILLWIPCHIVTFSMHYREDYRAAGIPTFASVYGDRVARAVVAISSVGAAAAIVLGMVGLGLSWGYLRVASLLSLAVVALALWSVVRPSAQLDLRFFKVASLYMASAMVLVILGAHALARSPIS